MDVGIYPKNTHAWAKAPAEFLFCKVVKQLYPRSAELAKRPTTVKRSFKYEWAFYASDAFGDPVFVIANALFANWQACWPYKGKHAGLIMHEGTSFLDFVRIVPPPRHGCGETAIGPDILRTIERAAAMTGGAYAGAL